VTVPTKEEREAWRREAEAAPDGAFVFSRRTSIRLLAALDEVERQRDEARAAALRLKPWVEHAGSCPKCGGSECGLCANVACDCGLTEALDAAKGATT